MTVEAAETFSEAEVLATGESIARAQEPSGAIAWPDGHVDAWDHVESAMALSACGLHGPARRAYAWLRDTQRDDGSWPRSSLGGRVTDPAAESHHAAYVAVGAWHEYLVTGDESHALTMWPTVRRAVEWALALRTSRGEVAWERDASGTAGTYALLSGCSSIHQSLRCAVALGKLADDPQPDWELAADRLADLVGAHPEAFADKSRFAMDWYYPVLGGAVRGAAAVARLKAGWDTFVVPGLGVRCVSDQPWVTGAETCELVLALDACGLRAGGRDVRHHRAPASPGRLVLDRLAVRQPGALPGRAVKLDRGRRGPGGRRADWVVGWSGGIPGCRGWWGWRGLGGGCALEDAEGALGADFGKGGGG